MATKWPLIPWYWALLILWSLLAIGVWAVLLVIYRLRAWFRGP